VFCPKQRKNPEKKNFAETEMVFSPVDITEVYTEEGKLYLLVGIDRMSPYAYVDLFSRMCTEESTLFLKDSNQSIPDEIHPILTDNGAQFTNKQFKSPKEHAFNALCRENNVLHKLTKPYHPWTNGQAERRPPPKRSDCKKVFL
jgi:transposase InsO family protein